MFDWLEKYPQVRAMLQQDGDVLLDVTTEIDAVVDDVVPAVGSWTVRSMADYLAAAHGFTGTVSIRDHLPYMAQIIRLEGAGVAVEISIEMDITRSLRSLDDVLQVSLDRLALAWVSACQTSPST